jgi:hypothetical protein
MPWEQRTHIYLCRDLKENLRDFWPKVEIVAVSAVPLINAL